MTQVKTTSLPIIDWSQLHDGPDARARLAAQLDSACSEFGFFYLVGHPVPHASIDSLISLAREFFAGPVEAKRSIHMSKGGARGAGIFSSARSSRLGGRTARKEFTSALSSTNRIREYRQGCRCTDAICFPPRRGRGKQSSHIWRI
jgi:isopenicillin N synthase-like dioxygenase